MGSIVSWYRSFLIVSVVSVPFTLVGYLFLGAEGAWIGLSFGLVTVLLAGLFCESMIARVFNSSEPVSLGIQNTLKRVIENSPEYRQVYQKSGLPGVMIFPDPAPNALVVRGLRSSGTVLLSQGLISTLKEEDLRQIIKRLVYESHRPGIVLSSISAIFAAFILSLAPRQWVRTVFVEEISSSGRNKNLTPKSAFLFLILYPFVDFFLQMGRPLRRKMEKPPQLQNVQTLHSVWSLVSRPGFANLYLTDIQQ